MMKQRWGLDRRVLRPTPGDPWGVEQHHWNTGAEENQQLNPGGPVKLKVKLMRTLILSTFHYACESWTLTAEIERRIQAFEMRCYRRPLNISYKDHVTNEEVCNRIQNAIGVYDDFLTMVKKRKLRWYGHISRSSGMAKTILQGIVKGARRRVRQKKRWDDNIKEWTGMGFGDSLRAAPDREGWKGIVATSSAVPRWPPRLRDRDETR